jgi:hypothetical protein
LRDPRHATRAVREYLAALDEQGEPITPPASISPTDPAARWTAAPGGPAFYAYSTNYLVDVQAGIIVDVEATPAWRTAEVNSTRTMIERVEQRFNLKPERLIGDMAYGAAPMLGWLVEEKPIAPHIPVWDKSEPDDGTFGRSDFTFDAENNRYICPARQGPQTRMAEPSEEKSLSLLGQPVRLPGLPIETQVLSQHGDPQD